MSDAAGPYSQGFNPGQYEMFHVDDDVDFDVCLFQGGMGSGKTFAGSLLGVVLCWRYPGIIGLVVAKTYPLLRDTTLKEYLDHLERIGLRQGKHYTFNKSEGKIIFKCWGGSTLLFRHLQTDEAIKSLTVGFVEVEEGSQITEADFRMLLARLRQKGLPRYRMFLHSNPQATKGWMHKVFVENGGKHRVTTEEGKEVVMHYRRIIAPTRENRFNPPSYLENMRKMYDEEYFRVMVEGQDADYTSGLVVKGWSAVNETDVEYRPALPLYLGCDYNVDPMCWVLYQRYNREYHFFDEIAFENTDIEECAEALANAYPGNEVTQLIITGDASGKSRGVLGDKNKGRTAYDQLINCLVRFGYPRHKIKKDLKAKNPPVHDRIRSWNAMVCNADGIRRIFANPNNCPWLVWNMYNVKYIPGSSQIWKPTTKDIETTREFKFYLHPLDAASYGVEKYDPIRLELPPDGDKNLKMGAIHYKASHR